jgi:bifunctional polynucleotide phosphatase/kinase
LKREVEEGKHLVVLSNQADSRPKIRAEWKAKLPLIAAKVSLLSLPLFPLLQLGEG